MQIPSEFHQGAIKWRVKSVEDLGDRTGQTDPNKSLVLLEKNANKQVFGQTFCHELMHVFFYEAGINDHDEVLIDKLSRSLFQFIEENYGE